MVQGHAHDNLMDLDTEINTTAPTSEQSYENATDFDANIGMSMDMDMGMPVAKSTADNLTMNRNGVVYRHEKETSDLGTHTANVENSIMDRKDMLLQSQSQSQPQLSSQTYPQRPPTYLEPPYLPNLTPTMQLQSQEEDKIQQQKQNDEKEKDNNTEIVGADKAHKSRIEKQKVPVDIDANNTHITISKAKSKSNALYLLTSFFGLPVPCCCDGSPEEKKDSVIDSINIRSHSGSNYESDYSPPILPSSSRSQLGGRVPGSTSYDYEDEFTLKVSAQPYLGMEPSKSLPISIRDSSGSGSGSGNENGSSHSVDPDKEHEHAPLHETFGVPYHTPSYTDGLNNNNDSRNGYKYKKNSRNGSTHDNEVAKTATSDMSGPIIMQPPPPQSYIDPKDGHIWRAKYCVLVDGVLYFYRNAAIGNSPEAENERDAMSSHPKYEAGAAVDEADHLGKSPMPRNLLHSRHQHATLHPMLSTREKNGGGSFCNDPNVYWEKRVALNMVGAVRSSQDFGECAFELIAINSGSRTGADEDNDNNGDGDGNERDRELDQVDRLVLRASKADDMSLWIFEIHKSFVKLMKQLAAVVGSHDSKRGIQIGGAGQSKGHGQFSQRHLSGSNFGPKSIAASLTLTPPLMMNRGRSISARNELLAPQSPLIAPIAGIRNSPETMTSLLQGQGGTRIIRMSFDRDNEGSAEFPEIASPSRTRSSSDEYVESILRPSMKMTKLKISSSRSSTRLNEEGSLPKEEKHNFTPMTPTPEVEGTTKIKPLAGKYVPPHLRKEASTKKYIPPHLRKKMEASKLNDDILGPDKNLDRETVLDAPVDLIQQIQSENEEFEYLQHSSGLSVADKSDSSESSSLEENAHDHDKFIKLGGCADPFLVGNSVCHESYKHTGASKVTSDHDGYGFINEMSEIGAVSKIGIRDYNEDAYLILNDLLKIRLTDDLDPFDPSDSYFYQFEQRGLFAIFDGHCGNQAARYAAEKFQSILLEESLNLELDSDKKNDHHSTLRQILHEAVTRLDDDFCEFCTADGRDWYAGSTAIVAVVLDDHIVVASIGDASGVFSASTGNVDRAIMNDWSVLEQEEEELNKIGGSTKGIIYKEVNESHCPSRPEEKERIHAANGWVTHETEIPIITQFQRMDWGDKDVLDIFLRCFSDRLDSSKAHILNIYRVCGDLAVSRAIGDKEYKAAFNQDQNDSLADGGNEWRSPAPMPYYTYKDLHNEEHSGLFEGDLVISTPGIRFFELGSHGTDEFLLIACDGLWDVMGPDDAVRVTRDLLFEVEISARECAERLAQIAKGLGSSDNITVIVVRFYGK